MFYADEDLPDHYTLTDVATLYGWRRVSSALYIERFRNKIIAAQTVSLSHVD